MFIILSVPDVTQRVPPTCTIKTHFTYLIKSNIEKKRAFDRIGINNVSKHTRKRWTKLRGSIQHPKLYEDVFVYFDQCFTYLRVFRVRGGVILRARKEREPAPSAPPHDQRGRGGGRSWQPHWITALVIMITRRCIQPSIKIPYTIQHPYHPSRNVRCRESVTTSIHNEYNQHASYVPGVQP